MQTNYKILRLLRQLKL